MPAGLDEQRAVGGGLVDVDQRLRDRFGHTGIDEGGKVVGARHIGVDDGLPGRLGDRGGEASVNDSSPPSSYVRPTCSAGSATRTAAAAAA